MKDAGLKPAKELYERCLGIPTRDTMPLKKVISEVSTCSAYVCFSKPRAEELISCLTEDGVTVPDQVSVAGANPPDGEIASGLHLTGIGFSPENEIAACIELLREQMRGETSKVGTIMLAPFEVEGNTLTDKAT